MQNDHRIFPDRFDKEDNSLLVSFLYDLLVDKKELEYNDMKTAMSSPSRRSRQGSVYKEAQGPRTISGHHQQHFITSTTGCESIDSQQVLNQKPQMQLTAVQPQAIPYFETVKESDKVFDDSSLRRYSSRLQHINPDSEFVTANRRPTSPAHFIKSIDALLNAMNQTHQSQQCIYDWDKKMGLKKSHSKTMRNTRKSRKQIQRNLKKLTFRAKRKGKSPKTNAVCT
uniref:Uncharacterized protein n=1 Tax=Eucampia antarctica TaxID=49252 RepID=A0A7S2SLP2_9STRA|mmetsp:Transcript_9151/g.8757  ORF Transcript_9151/g.8757 Transcript_9151/m.8757 type:complete len:226 (+) Transcript_9151:323-1000(+)